MRVIYELIEDLRDYGSVKGNIGILARLDEIQQRGMVWIMDRKVIYRAGIMAILEEKEDDILMMKAGRLNHNQQTYEDRIFLKHELQRLDYIEIKYEV